MKNKMHLIETDDFPFEFLSQLAERESWRKEVHRPIYHVHKWWAKRLGSVFRGILLGCALPERSDLATEFYKTHSFSSTSVFDPFMGSGTTVGEAHKLGFTAFGQDINPVAVNAARVAFGPLERDQIEQAFEQLSRTVGEKLRSLYRSRDASGQPCDVLYYFWVMQAGCPACHNPVNLFPSWVIARNAYPSRKPEIQILCPGCGSIFTGLHGQNKVSCSACGQRFNPEDGPAKGAKVTCQECYFTFTVLTALKHRRPAFRLFAKLVLTQDGEKQYLPATDADHTAYANCSQQLAKEATEDKTIALPSLTLEDGFNTRQAISYGFTSWRDFFNDRQLLALAWLHRAIKDIAHESTRDALLILFSGTLEFNNMFASYKGEGTGAVRHMFAHHILKPERTPIEANLWGTIKSSGSFSGLFRTRLLRAIDYRNAPTEVNGTQNDKGKVCSPPFTGQLQPWPEDNKFVPRGLYLSCGDSSKTHLADKSIDLIVTDPPFFDNVHYSELADFFYSWQQLHRNGNRTTRNIGEVQDADASRFASKLGQVFKECQRVLKDDGLLIFTYHHSREEGWQSLAEALDGAGFAVVNCHPVKSEMSVAMPKTQAKEPIQLDIILVCRKVGTHTSVARHFSVDEATAAARAKLSRLGKAGFKLSSSDRRIVMLGQILTAAGGSIDPATIETQLKAVFA